MLCNVGIINSTSHFLEKKDFDSENIVLLWGENPFSTLSISFLIFCWFQSFCFQKFCSQKKSMCSLKSDFHLSKIFFVWFNDSLFNMMKNAFCFILKALFVLKMFVFNCYCEFLVMQKKRLEQKDKVTFKVYDVTTWLGNNCNTLIFQYLTK